MTVITINGQIGSAGPEIGAEVARRLRFDYIDRLILAEAAKRIGATVEALAAKERRTLNLSERIANFMQTVMEHSTAPGMVGDPYLGGFSVLLGQEYEEAVKEPISRADQLRDKQFIQVTTAVIRDLAEAGNAVIIGRAGNLILRDRPDIFHVGLVSTLESRIKVIAEREGVSLEEAQKSAVESEKARQIYFRKYFNVMADAPAHFHMMLNTHLLAKDDAACIIVQAVSS